MRRCCHREATASGFTLVELMVVVAIVGLLMAMLLPAVQNARETSRRSACANNLRQVGAAIHMYHNAHEAFPPGAISPGGLHPDTDPTYTCWTIQLLPFLDQKAIYERYNQSQTNDSRANKFVRETYMPIYSCPSDLSRDTLTIPDSGPAQFKKIPYMPGSYRGVGGKIDGRSTAWWDSSPEHKKLPRRWRGVFHVNDGHLCPERFSSISDGLSNTLMVGESSTRPSKPPPRNKDAALVQRLVENGGMGRRTFWAYTYGPYNRSDAVSQSRTLIGDVDRCSIIGGEGDFQPCYRAWGSFHTDLLNFVLCDGSVQTFPLAIDTRVFTQSATVAGKEFAPLP